MNKMVASDLNTTQDTNNNTNNTRLNFDKDVNDTAFLIPTHLNFTKLTKFHKSQSAFFSRALSFPPLLILMQNEP